MQPSTLLDTPCLTPMGKHLVWCWETTSFHNVTDLGIGISTPELQVLIQDLTLDVNL
jgi:hypothetical protein